MSGIEIIAVIFCLALCTSISAMAWWAFKISSALTRMRDADQLARETQGRSILGWVVQVAEDVKGLVRRHDATVEHLRRLHDLLDSSCKRPTIAIAPPPVQETSPVEATAPTVEASPQVEPAPGNHVRESDADTQCWQGPISSRTMVSVGIPPLPRPLPAPTPPPERAKR
jgi:hypothetical protein